MMHRDAPIGGPHSARLELRWVPASGHVDPVLQQPSLTGGERIFGSWIGSQIGGAMAPPTTSWLPPASWVADVPHPGPAPPAARSHMARVALVPSV
jgi:hypothetical protein